MSDGDALLRAILANPADDTARLVYADWLDEQGQGERAEFIRVQCEIAVIAAEEAALGQKGGRKSLAEYERCDRLAWRRRELESRERAVLSAHWRAWVPLTEGYVSASYPTATGESAPAVEVDGRTYLFRRGFVSHVTCTAADWLAHADALVAAHPVERVTLTTWAGRPEVLEDHYLEDRWPRIAFTLSGG